MRKARKIALMLIAVFCLACFTGCIRYNVTVDVKGNGKADLSMMYSSQVSGDDVTEDDKATNDKTIEDLKSKGWDCQEYREGEYYGYLCKKTNVDIKNIAAEMNADEEDQAVKSENIKLTKKGLFTYVLDWTFESSSGADEGDGEGEGEDDAGLSDSDRQAYADGIKQAGGYMTFTLKVPTKAKNSNASTVSADGKTLEWDLLALKDGEVIHAEFTVINWPIVIGICAGVLVLIAVIVVCIVMASKKKQA